MSTTANSTAKSERSETKRGGRRSVLDALGAIVGSLVYRRRRFFHQSLESPPLRTAVRATTTEVKSLDPGHWHEVRCDGPAGRFTAACLVHRWNGPDRPALIYVHGSGEQPRDFDVDANLVLVMAPFHETTQGAYIDALAELRNYVGMLASATSLVDSLAKRLRSDGAPTLFGAGFRHSTSRLS